MNLRTGWVIVAILAVIIVALAGALFLLPSPKSESAPFTSENVRVFSPVPSASVGKTFTAKGEARGTWYFEASFPIFVLDNGGEKVGQGIAQAQSDWMTEDWVPFTAQVVVDNYTGPATLSLIKDNPSGLPEHDDSVSFSIVVQ